MKIIEMDELQAGDIFTEAFQVLGFKVNKEGVQTSCICTSQNDNKPLNNKRIISKQLKGTVILLGNIFES